MTLDTLLTEAQGLPEDALMEVVRFVRFIKSEIQARPSGISLSRANEKPVRTAGKYRGKIKMAEDFDEPLDEFKEYV